MEKKVRLQASLRFWDATAIVVGCVIGVGVFRVAAPIAEHVATPGLVMLVWLVGGLLSFCGALCFAELGAAYPKSGGDYVYLSKAYGPTVGFLFGWTKLFVERIGTIAILGHVFAEYLGYLVPSGTLGIKLCATLGVAALTAANIVGLHLGKQLQNVLTLMKVAALLAIVGIGWFHPPVALGLEQPIWPERFTPQSLQAFGVALVFVIWTYGGWNEVTYVAEEVQDPKRTLPASILWGVGAITILYLAVHWVYLKFVPLAAMPEKPLIAAEVMEAMLGPLGAAVTALMVACSALGACNGEILTGGRIALAMGRDHALFRHLSVVHPTAKTPARALAFNAAGASVLIWAGTFEQIVTYSTVVLAIFFVMTALAVPVLRRRDPATPRPYRVWGYPVTPALFIGGTGLFVANVAWMQPRETLLGFGLLTLGLPLYGWSQTMRKGLL